MLNQAMVETWDLVVILWPLELVTGLLLFLLEIEVMLHLFLENPMDGLNLYLLGIDFICLGCWGQVSVVILLEQLCPWLNF